MISSPRSAGAFFQGRYLSLATRANLNHRRCLLFLPDSLGMISKKETDFIFGLFLVLNILFRIA
jgi:hypothetical protein